MACKIRTLGVEWEAAERGAGSIFFGLGTVEIGKEVRAERGNRRGTIALVGAG